MEWVQQNVLNCKFTCTKPGSISHLLFGEKPSEQSISIKVGHLGEFIAKELIQTNPQLELLPCGIQQIYDNNDKIKKGKMDIDLIFKDETNHIIYYRELKGNIELDTEKIKATIYKCNEINKFLKTTHANYRIDCGILNWSVYDREILTAGRSNIKTLESGEIKVDHVADFLRIIQVVWKKDDYYAYFRQLGNTIKTKYAEICSSHTQEQKQAKRQAKKKKNTTTKKED